MAVVVGAATGRLRRMVDHDARIDRHRARGIDDDGVDVHLAQLGQLAHHFRHAQQNLLQRIPVDRRRTAPVAQCFSHA